MTDFLSRAQALGAATSTTLTIKNQEDHDRIMQSMLSPALADADKVQDYSPRINAQEFPTQLAVYSLSDLIIQLDHPFIINDTRPVVLNYGTVTIENGAYIEVSSGACNFLLDILLKPSSTTSSKGYDIANIGSGPLMIHVSQAIQVNDLVIATTSGSGDITILIPKSNPVPNIITHQLGTNPGKITVVTRND
jgi:hypothetical protein